MTKEMNKMDEINMNILMKYNEIPRVAVETGYKMKTTLWGDFGIADTIGGEKEIRDTYRRTWKAFKDDKEYGTELSLVLNWKIWEWYEKDEKIAKVYDELWRKTDAYIMENWKGEELNYYIRTTD